MTWLDDTFRTAKPVIAMLHLKPLPGDPGYDAALGMPAVVADARAQLRDLQEGGVDAVMFSNEFSLPYLTRTEPVTAAAMARVIGELRAEISVPFGVNVLWDGIASLDVAAATGARFVREIYSGVYASDFGLWDTNVGEAARHRRRIEATGVGMLYNIVPEGATYLAERDVEAITRTTIFNCHPEALCVSGATAGSATDSSVLRRVKSAAGETPVLANTGVRLETIAQQMAVADGVVVGTALKAAGRFENAPDVGRVREFMAEVRRVRTPEAVR